MSEETKYNLIIAVVVLLFLAAGIAYGVWQFKLCYGNVSDSWWYCFQHAFGG